ncbi:MAG TPA: pyridoxal-phosphate dependent enzyme, partial [candidate division Zixibacteria bacterium]|nr:pyridoxal-phosphate dependent enzyme [candidate division Zixibacteria bacterium]
AASKGYKCVLVMPESMSLERRALLKLLGAKLVLTPKEKGMGGAIEKAKELLKEQGGFQPEQFSNPANPEIHKLTTGPEIVADLGDINLDVFIAGVGTGGTVSGAGSVLKEKYNSKIIAVEPTDSAVLSGGEPGPHMIQGIGAGFIPENYDASVVDEIVQIENEAAFETSRQLALKEGIVAGISSGANVQAALNFAKKLGKGKTVVTIICDTGERYISTPLMEN